MLPPESADERGPSYRQIVRQSWPIVVANSAVPLLGLADTAVIGRTGGIVDLGAIALGSLIFSFLYWGFGFLRMGTTGFTAQAAGAGDEAEVRATLGRALLLAFGLGLALILLRSAIDRAALGLFGASADVEGTTHLYFSWRIWGAPASLATFAILGTFVGLGRSASLLQTQIFLNGLNITLDVVFAGVLGWGARGIALGTAISEWATLGLALVLVRGALEQRRIDDEPLWPWPRILDRRKLARMVGANFDIMVRTLALLFAFGWFTDRGARFGDAVLAANHVLMQLVSLSAYFLDGYAFTTEALVGRALGRGRRVLFDVTVRRAGQLSAGTAVALAAAIALLGPWSISALTDLEAVRQAALDHLPWAAAYVLVSFVAFQLDGIFIGATRTRDMRTTAIVALAVFLVADRLLVPPWGNHGLWAAFVIYVVARAASLAACYPRLRASIGASAPTDARIKPAAHS